jgi:hypothetical protein
LPRELRLCSSRIPLRVPDASSCAGRDQRAVLHATRDRERCLQRSHGRNRAPDQEKVGAQHMFTAVEFCGRRRSLLPLPRWLPSPPPDVAEHRATAAAATAGGNPSGGNNNGGTTAPSNVALASKAGWVITWSLPRDGRCITSPSTFLQRRGRRRSPTAPEAALRSGPLPRRRDAGRVGLDTADFAEFTCPDGAKQTPSRGCLYLLPATARPVTRPAITSAIRVRPISGS